MHEPAGDEVAENVAAEEPGDRRAAIHEAPGDRRADTAAVFGNRWQQVQRRAAGEAGGERALEAAPAVVAAVRHAVDLLPLGLTDVSHPERSRTPVEAPAPRVAQPGGVDLRAGLRSGPVHVAARRAGERIVAGDGVGPRHGDIDAQHLAEQRRHQLAVADGAVLVIPAAAVADADVEEAVRTEGDVAAVVVGFGLADL